MIYISTFESYNKPRSGGKKRWSVSYKRGIDCSNPKGFSQKQYCKRKRRGGHYKTESINLDHIQEITETLNDMVYELRDRDFVVQIERHSLEDSLQTHLISIRIFKFDWDPYNIHGNYDFRWSDISNSVLTITDYLISENFIFDKIRCSFLTRGWRYDASMGFRVTSLSFLQNTRFNNTGDYCDIPFYLFQIQFKY